MSSTSDAYIKAVAEVERNEDGGVDEKKLLERVAAYIDIDVPAEKIRKAKTEVRRRCKPGSTEATGQLSLPGIDMPYGYEPDRLVADDDGHLIENRNARPNYKAAEARRAQKHAEDAQRWATRKQHESSLFNQWYIEQMETGRPTMELTFQTFVMEIGYWEDDAADPEDAPEDLF